MSFEISALILTWVALLLLALVVSGLIRQVHQLSAGPAAGTRPPGPAAGAPAPGIAGLGGGPALLLFLSRDCRVCADVLDEASTTAEPGLPVRPLYQGEADELFTAYDAAVTPFGVLVGPDGRVDRSGALGSRRAVRGLLSADAARPAIEIGGDR